MKINENQVYVHSDEDKNVSLCSLEKYNMDNMKNDDDDQNKVVITGRSFDP